MGRVKKKGRNAGSFDAWSDRYINRELSWLEFNRRVLAEAQNADNPLLERLKFLAIFESNLDEFYMVRVSGLIEQFEGGFTDLTPDGLSPSDQLDLIYERALPMRSQAGVNLTDELLPQLEANGITLRRFQDLAPKQRGEMEEFFMREVFPVCTPLLLHPTPTVPFISNRSLNLAVELAEPAGGEVRLARVKIPSILSRVVRLYPRKNEFVLLEDVVINNLHHLFPGVEVKGAHLFRVIRDADVEIRELEAADLLSRIEETLKRRRFGAPVRMDLQPTMPAHVRSLLSKLLELDHTDIFEVEGHLGLEFLWDLSKVDRVTLKFPLHQAFQPEAVAESKNLFEAIRRDDFLLHHPYDSFRPVETFISAAAHDPKVIGIKQTLYRVGSESPVVESLLRAAEANKQVAVMVELKARFDESNNLVWARALERAGVHVSYGFSDLKTHCKLCLIVRREVDGLRTYAHIGTGNYNPVTARLYTDFGLFTDDPDITQDIAELFNFLTGFSRQANYRKLLVAPLNLREGILERIERERQLHLKKGGGRIIFKLNALVDPEVIDALYLASQAGVQIDLIVRGICCLRPGLAGLSENIRVLSIVGRFLEHSRAYYFHNGGSPEAYIGSADVMRRNLDRRIEVLTPVERPQIIEGLLTQVLEICLQDTEKAWVMKPDGMYIRRVAAKGEKSFNAQEWLMKHPMGRLFFEPNNPTAPTHP
jgi:polyphosphate kinase